MKKNKQEPDGLFPEIQTGRFADFSDYKSAVPHLCGVMPEDHIHMLGLCWGVTSGRTAKLIGQEGPQYCSSCEASCRSKRYHDHIKSKEKDQSNEEK